METNAATKPVRLNWTACPERSTTECTVAVATHNGNRIFRLRNAGWNDTFMVFAGDTGTTNADNLGTAASIAQARKLAERN